MRKIRIVVFCAAHLVNLNLVESKNVENKTVEIKMSTVKISTRKNVESYKYRNIDSPNFGRKEKRRNVIMSKSKKVENKNGTNVEMLNAYKHQHMIVRNFNALILTCTFFPSLLFLFSTFSFFGIFMFRHFYFRPKLGLPKYNLEI